jgi:C4-dicarboxylate-specific signal transduction histidine kinase
VLTASIAHEVNQPLIAANIDAGTCQLMQSANPPNVECAREALVARFAIATVRLK